MTPTARRRTRRPTPWPVHLVRLLVAVEVGFAAVVLVFLGFFTGLGLFLGLGNGGGAGLAGIMLALIGLLGTFVRLSIRAAAGLRHDHLRARTTLVRLQWALVAALLITVPIRNVWILGLVDTSVPLLVLLGCGGGVLFLLRVPRTGHRYSGHVPAAAPGSDS